jgi:actin-related protein
MSENPVVVMDNGSGYLKAGFANDEHPKCKFPAVVGRPHNASVIIGTDNKAEYIGEDAEAKRGVLKLEYPIKNGIVHNWDDMEKVWTYCFDTELRVTPSESEVLLTEAPLNPKANREKMAEIMFENFQVLSLYIGIQAVLSLYAAGRVTGIVLDSGDGVTHTVPIYEGYSIPHAVKRNLFAGRELTHWMAKSLNSSIGKNFHTGAEMEIVKAIKEKVCFVSQDYEADLQKANESQEFSTPYELPDGEVISVNVDRFKCPEALFKPDLCGQQIKGIHDLTFESIKECDTDVKKELYESIILSGGTTLYEGIAERLTKELTALAPKAIKINVVAQPDRYYAVWKGGSTLASLASFQEQTMTKSDYEEHGAEYVHKKFL